MADDSDGEAYTDIDMDSSGRPIIPSGSLDRRPPLPAPPSPVARTPPSPRVAPRPPVRRGSSLQDRVGPLPPIPRSAEQSPKIPKAELVRRQTFTSSNIPTPGYIPPLPPKPLNPEELNALLRPKHFREKLSMNDFEIDKEELEPAVFVKKYQEKFPLKVRVCKGFYGHSERTSVSEGDTFNIHFVKHTKVVHMLDGGGADYRIPLNSALEFGIMFDPNNKRDQALNGFTFDRVADIIAAKTPPVAVKVGAGWRGSGPSSTITENELLVIKTIKKKKIKFYSPSTGKKKELPDNCVGKFTTKPAEVRFFLSEIMEHVPQAIPCQAMLFVHSETAAELPAHLVTAVVNLSSTSTETSLIATNTDVDDFTDAPMFDIPLDIDIELQVLRPKKKEDTEQLYTDTRTLLENYKPSKVTQYSTSSSSTSTNIYNIVRRENPLTGVDLVKPPTIYYNLEVLPQQASVQSDNSSAGGIYSEANELTDSHSDKRDSGLMDRLSALEETVQQLSSTSDSTEVKRQITSARADMKRLEGRAVKATEDSQEVKKQLSDLTSTISSMQGLLKNLADNVSQLQQTKPPAPQHSYMSVPGPHMTGSPSHMTGPASHGYVPMSPNVDDRSTDSGIYHVIPADIKSPPGKFRSPEASTPASPAVSQQSIPESVYEENKQFLMTLDYMQVLKLLELMGLKQYQEMFMTERINGEMLLECDDEVLQTELKVTSKLRRVRLLKLISGRHSAEQILRGEDPYVYATSR